MYIEEAFKRLNLLEDDYSYSEDQQLELLNKAVSDDIDDIPEEEIIDVDAETCDDLQDNYIGKIIVECDCCHARLYKDPEDLILGSSEDGVELFNIEEECPVCHTNSGFRVIGKIEQYSDDAIKPEEPEEPEEEHEEPTEEDDEFEKEVHEALQEALNPGECVAILNKNEFDETGDAEAIAAKIESDYIPGNEVFDTLNVTCKVQGDNIVFTGPKVDIDTLYNRMFNDEITPDYVECATEESEEEPEETVEFDSEEDAKNYYDDHSEELKLEGYNSFDEWFDGGVEKINEALDSVKVITDDGEVTVENDDDKLVVDLSSDEVDEDVEPEPTNEDDNPGEMIAPLTDEEEDDILNTAELNAEEAGEDEGEFEEPEPLEEPEPFEEPEPELGEEEPAEEEEEESEKEEEAEEEEVEESLHEALSDRLKAKLARMSNKEESEEDPVGESLTEDKDEEPFEEDEEEVEPFEDDDEVEHLEDSKEPVCEELTITEKERALLQYMIDNDLSYMPTKEEKEKIYKEYEEKKNAASKELQDNEDDDVTLECLEDFNESNFNKICESYLRRVYENVNTFNCTAVKNRDNKLIVEGVIQFVSGNKKQTAFEFTNPVVTKRGKVVLEGLNKTFTSTQNAYILKGRVENKEFISESMIYRYTAKTLNESNQPESIKFYGRVVCK